MTMTDYTIKYLEFLTEQDKDLIQIAKDRVIYIAINKSYKASDPEEQVRASFYLELIKKYKYPKERIDLEITVPRRKPEDRADIIIYEDEEKKVPYLVVECKKDGITDALRNFKDIRESKKDFKQNRFDIILTNPPFGATIKDTETDYLPIYELGSKKDTKRKNQKTEILFIERCVDFVKPQTGRIGIVLPDGILTNSSLQYVDFIMERCQILAVVSLPQFAFSHFGAGVKSSLVFLRKKDENEKLEKYPIFMAIADHIGYDATGRKDPINDFDTIYEEYQKFSKNPRNYQPKNQE